ncbi:MAG: hypothetical protein SFV15_07670 [Polyangiaceae bacterium]|nr:hypothetical protein [Polyangiaceae bacterium]
MTGRASADKRRKEKERQDRKKDKAERRQQRKEVDKPERGADEEDPDIAGIVPGPQPLPDGFGDGDAAMRVES